LEERLSNLVRGEIMFFKDTQTVDLTRLLRPYENKWVAIAEDRSTVLAAADSFAELQRLTQGVQEKYIVLKVLPFDASYVPEAE
jgi:hypothetical protein